MAEGQVRIIITDPSERPDTPDLIPLRPHRGEPIMGKLTSTYPDGSKPLPLYIDVNHPDAPKIQVYLNGKLEHRFIEVDVLGCTGVRVMMNEWGYPMYDDDGHTRFERVYGQFKLEWIAPPSITINFDGSG